MSAPMHNDYRGGFYTYVIEVVEEGVHSHYFYNDPDSAYEDYNQVTVEYGYVTLYNGDLAMVGDKLVSRVTTTSIVMAKKNGRTV